MDVMIVVFWYTVDMEEEIPAFGALVESAKYCRTGLFFMYLLTVI